jgi:(S)-citramalyl-CoA lyase
MMLVHARSLLFVPGNRPERFTKAGASGADMVCIDLEDAVPPAERVAARAAVLAFLHDQPAGHRYGVRINRLASVDALHDAAALSGSNTAPAFVMLAKTESARELELLAAWLPNAPQIALIESARGMQAAASIAQAGTPLQALMFGGADFSAELGCEWAWEPLLHARSSLLLAASAAGIGCIDVPWLDVANPTGAEEEARRVASLGFSGKALIHPSQVAPVHAGFAPSAQTLERARRVVAASGANDAAVLVDGRLVDRPVVLAAQRALRRVGEFN